MSILIVSSCFYNLRNPIISHRYLVRLFSDLNPVSSSIHSDIISHPLKYDTYHSVLQAFAIVLFKIYFQGLLGITCHFITFDRGLICILVLFYRC